MSLSEPSRASLPRTWSTRFELRGELGVGSMGVVHRVFDRELGREVALKTLRANTPELFYVLKEEFRAAASVVHPNLVELYELFVEGQSCFFTMELLDAVPFHVWLGRAAPRAPLAALEAQAEPSSREHPTLAWAESTTLRVSQKDPDALPLGSAAAARLASGAAQLFRALSALHDAGRIHCDLKPSNILVTRSGRVCVLDFGLSAPRWGQLARSGFSGTLAYAAPEQMWGGELTPAADWYSFGVVLFEALTGYLPEGEVHLATSLQHLWASLGEASKACLPPQLPKLVAALLQLDPAQRPSRDAIARVLDPRAEAGESAPEHTRQFVGRHTELAALHGALRAARDGWLSVVAVRGESGVGKTELIRQFTLEASADSALVARGQSRLDESVAYQAVDHVIDDLSRHLSLVPVPERQALLPGDFPALARVFPVLARLAKIRDGCADVDPVTLRQRAVLALQQLLWRICAWRPVVLWVDDAQWGDAESQSLIVELLRDLAPPVLLILSHRDQDVPWLQPIAQAVAQAQGQWIEITAAPFDRAESAALAQHLLGDLARSRPQLIERVASESDGVPIFIAQLCRLISETAQPDRFDSEPLRLDDIIERRVAGLDLDERRLSELAALLETPLPIDVVTAAAGLAAGRARVVSRLAAAQLLRITGPRPDPRLTSFHEHVRQGILCRLDPARRRSSHALLARALERTEACVAPEVLLHHWTQAGEPQHARAVALRAADAAMAQLAFNHAAGLYHSVLEQLADTDPDRQRVQASLAGALSAAGRAVEAGARYAELARRAAGQDALPWLQLAAEHFLTGGALDEGLAILKEALARVGMKLPSSAGMALLQGLRHAVLVRMSSRSRLDGEMHRERAAMPAAASAELGIQTDLCLSAAKGLGVVNPMSSLYFALVALRLAARAADPARLATAQSIAGFMLASAGGPVGRWGRDWLDAATRYADLADDRLLEGQVLACEAQVDVNRGAWNTVLRNCEMAQQCLERTRTPPTWERNMVEVAALRALEENGELKRAWQRARDWRADAKSRGDLYAQTTADMYLAFACLGEDDPERAEHTANQALARWTATPPPFQEFYRLRLLAYAELYRGKFGAASSRLEQAVRAARTGGLHRFPMLILEMDLLNARIRLPAARAGDRQAFASVIRSIDRIAALPREDVTAQVELLRAGLAVRGEAAREHLQRARASFVARGVSLGSVYTVAAEAALDRLPEHDSCWQQCYAPLVAQGIRAPRAWLAMFAPMLHSGNDSSATAAARSR